jgi:hypothetical protein
MIKKYEPVITIETVPKIKIEQEVNVEKNNTSNKIFAIVGSLFSLILFSLFLTNLNNIHKEKLNNITISEFHEKINLINNFSMALKIYKIENKEFSHHFIKKEDVEKILGLVKAGYLKNNALLYIMQYDKKINIHSTTNKSIITYKFNSNDNELCKIINTDENISYLEKIEDINYLFSKFNENKNNNCFKTKIKNEYIYITS